MKRILMATVFLAMSAPAMAGQEGSNINIPAGLWNGNAQAGNGVAAANGYGGSATTGASTATGGAGGLGGTGGTATSSSGSSQSSTGPSNANGQVSNSTTFNSTSPSTIRNTPSVALGMATAYCQNSAGVGGSGPGFSFSAMFGKHDQDCVRYNYALALQALGEPEAALLVMSNNSEVNKALTESRTRRNAAMAPVPALQPVGMNAATARDPRPSRGQCNSIRRLADPTQVQRDFVAANCG